MKKELMKAAWIGLFMLLLSGCGKGQDTDSMQPTGGEGNASGQTWSGGINLPEGYALYARFEDAGADKGMNRGVLIGSSLYYYTNQYVPARNGHVQDFYVQERGTEAKNLLSVGYGDGKRLLDMAVGEDGSLYFLYGEGKGDSGFLTCTLEKRDGDFQVIYSVDATEGMEDIPGIYDMEAGADGTLYGLTMSGIVLCWDERGAFQGRFTLPDRGATAKAESGLEGSSRSCFGLVNAGRAGVYAYWGGENRDVRLYDLKKWQEMDEKQRETAEPLAVDFESVDKSLSAGAGSFLYLFSGHEDGIYLGDLHYLWRIDVTDGSLEVLFPWSDINLKASYVEEIWRQEDGGFLLYALDTLEQENYWVALEAVPVSEIPEKHSLVLGVAGSYSMNKSLTTDIDQVVLAYNRLHPYCNIVVKRYGSNDVTNFQLELLTGEGPDILLELESFFDIETLSARGIVEDLAPYLAGSEVISDEDILPGILALSTKDGKIPRIPLSFAMDVMILPENTRQETLTPQEMAEYMAGGEYIDYLVWPRDFLLQVLSGAEMDHYVDEEGKTCSFDSEEFISLLESLDSLGDMEMISKRGNRAELFRSGELNAVVEELNCLQDYFCIRNAFGGAGGIAGFPNSSGELRYPAKLYDWMGINSATAYKEDAWSFLEFCLSYTLKSDDFTDRFVVMKDKFDRQTQYEAEAKYFVWSNDYDDEWQGWQDVPSLTQEDTNLLWGISEHLYFYENDNLMEIIEEEAGAFFDGGISSEEAARRIQNRASLVVGE